MEPEEPTAPEPVEDLQQRQRLIGSEIRKYYQSAVMEKVPQHLIDLLHQLDSKEKPDAGT